MNTATAVKAATAGTVKLTIRQWATEDRPSVKLQMYGEKSLSDAELLAILIGSGTSKNTAVDIAQNLLDKFDQNLNNLGKARFDEINDVEGVGTSTACKVLAAVELGKRRQNAMAALKPDMGTYVAILSQRLFILVLPPIQFRHGKKLFKLLHPLWLHLPRIHHLPISL